LATAVKKQKIHFEILWKQSFLLRVLIASQMHTSWKSRMGIREFLKLIKKVPISVVYCEDINNHYHSIRNVDKSRLIKSQKLF
jgi:hypothetical protein